VTRGDGAAAVLGGAVVPAGQLRQRRRDWLSRYVTQPLSLGDKFVPL